MDFNLTKLKKTGEDVLVSPLVSITRPELITLGNHVAIDPWFHCTTGLATGDYVHIAANVSVIGGKKGRLILGNFTNISVGGIIICGSDEFRGTGIVSAPGLPEEFRDALMVEPIIFEDFANTGARVTIFPGTTIPQGTVIGACSLVRKSDVLKPWTIYAGNPLREIKSRPKEKMLEFARKMGYQV